MLNLFQHPTTLRAISPVENWTLKQVGIYPLEPCKAVEAVCGLVTVHDCTLLLMSRFYWRAFLIAVAVIVLGGGGYIGAKLHEAANQQHSDYKYQPATKARLNQAVTPKRPHQVYQPDCNQPQTESQSNLCGQWAAVEQADEANRLSSINVQLAIWIVILSAIGTVALVATLMDQRKTSRAELQAYVSVQMGGLPNIGGGEISVATIQIRNRGATPAYDMVQYGTVLVDEYPLKSDPFSLPLIRHGTGSKNTLNTGDPYNAFIESVVPILESELDEFRAGKKVIYVIGNVEYRDAFNRSRCTEFCYFLNIEAIRDADVQQQWNHANGKSEIAVPIKWALGNLHNNAT